MNNRVKPVPEIEKQILIQMEKRKSEVEALTRLLEKLKKEEKEKNQPVSHLSIRKLLGGKNGTTAIEKKK